MPKYLSVVLSLLLGLGGLQATAQEAEPPALQGLTGEERDRVASLIDGAREEGKFTFLTQTMQEDTFGVVSEAFKEYYGLPDLEMELALMRSSQLVARLSKEVQAGIEIQDVVHGGAPAFFDTLIKVGAIAEYESPEYQYYSKEVTTEDGAAPSRPGYFISGTVFYYGIVYNTDLVEGEITSWDDLLDEKYKGKIIVGDASKSTTYLDVYRGWKEVLPADYWTNLAKQEPIVILSSSNIIQRVISGEFAVGIFPSLRLVYQNQQSGVPNLKVVHPGNRNVAVGHQMVVMEKAPHPNASRLWVDFFHSKQGMELLVPLMGFASARSDVEVPAAAAAVSPPVGDMDLIPINWAEFTNEDSAKIKDEFASIFLQ